MGTDSKNARIPDRERDPPRWVVGLVGVVILAIAVSLFVWLERQDPGHRVAGTPAQFGQDEPIETLDAILDEPAKGNLVARQVVLDGVPVESVVGDFTFWVGPGRDRRVPVILLGELTSRQPERQTEIREGETLRVFGIIRRMREVDAIAQPGFLDASERQAVGGEEVFVSAFRVVTLEQ